jgi:hypothetical protein
MNVRFVSAVLLFACLTYSIESVSAQQRVENRQTPAVPVGERGQFQVFRLANADAMEVAKVLNGVIGDESRIATDERTNSVIIFSTPESLAIAQALLTKLDEGEDSKARRESRVFPVPKERLDEVLRHLHARGLTFNVTSTAGPRVGHMISVIGDRKSLEEASAIIDQVGSATAPRPQMRTRVLWLVSGTDEAMGELPAPPKDLEPVVQELSRLGIEKPRLAAQTIINGLAGQQLVGYGSLALPFANRITVNGTVIEGAAAPLLQIDIRVEGSPTARGSVAGANLSTQIATPPGHFVVLGVTPTDKLTSVFVVQVSSAEASNPGPEVPNTRPPTKR